MHHEHQSEKTLRSPVSCVRLCHGVLCIFLTTPLPYAAVAFYCGQYEKLLHYGKLATSYLIKIPNIPEVWGRVPRPTTGPMGTPHRPAIASQQAHSYANCALWRSAGGKRVCERILLDMTANS